MSNWADLPSTTKTIWSRSALGATACAILVAVGSVHSWAQSGAKQQFEVASVKPCDPHVQRGTNGGGGSPGRLVRNCQTLGSLVGSAYGIWASGGYALGGDLVNIVGGPAWINSDRYQIMAKAEGSPGSGTMNGPMMQALLEDRFKLKIHKETRVVPVYALVLTKAGLKLPKAKVECWTMAAGHPKNGQPFAVCGRGDMTKDGVEVHGSTMEDFCLALSHLPLQMERRKFVDKTGVAGRFDFDLKFPEELSATEDDLVRLQDALSKIGLQLRSEKGQDQFIVIDHAERPTEN